MPATMNPMRPAPGAPRPYHFPDFVRRELPNGLTVWVVEVPGAAVVNVHLLVDAGAAAEDEAHGGVAALTAQLLVTGTARLDASAFAEATEMLGIEVSSESSWDSARAAFQSLPSTTRNAWATCTIPYRRTTFSPPGTTCRMPQSIYSVWGPGRSSWAAQARVRLSRRGR